MAVTIFSPNSIPLFLNDLDCVGPVLPVVPSQLKFFDVYYTYEPVVGVHVIGANFDTCSAAVSMVALDGCED